MRRGVVVIAAAKVRTDALFQRPGCAETRQEFTLVFELSLPLLAQLEGPDGRVWTFARELLGEGLRRPCVRGGVTAALAINDPRYLVLSLSEFAVYLPVHQVQRWLDLSAVAVASVELSGADLDREWAWLDGAS
jgi:hypothetical protein